MAHMPTCPPAPLPWPGHRDQLVGLMDRVEIQMVSGADNPDAIRKAIAAGYFYHTARLQRDGSYRTIKNPQQVG